MSSILDSDRFRNCAATFEISLTIKHTYYQYTARAVQYSVKGNALALVRNRKKMTCQEDFAQKRILLENVQYIAASLESFRESVLNPLV